MKYRPSDLVQVPRASALCESMRSLGYSTGAAVADLIDNSIAARARSVWVSIAETARTGERRVAILDDGSGMTRDTLLAAMRPGTTNPLDPRSPSDLGRFGLGLKTASFSQCRCLTVATRWSDGDVSVLRWDLDHVRRTDRWELLEGPAPEVEEDMRLLERLPASGTLLLLSGLDRLTAKSSEMLADLKGHLGLTFHQLLENQVLRIHTSMTRDHEVVSSVDPIDPFLRTNPATRPTSEERVGTGCSLRGFVLPHPDRCTPSEWEAGALGTTWRDRQGCYVYRNRRLLVAGGWLGLDKRWRKDPDTQLARVQIEFDNTWDERWKLDVMKSRATPPAALRERLRDLASHTREGSASVFSHRHRRSTGDRPHGKSDDHAHVALWKLDSTQAGDRFRISEDHPAIRALCESSTLARPVLRLVEETLPMPAIWHAFSQRIGEGTDTRARERDLGRLRLDLLEYVQYELANSRPLEEIVSSVRAMEPYCDLEDLVDSVEAEFGGASAAGNPPGSNERRGSS